MIKNLLAVFIFVIACGGSTKPKPYVPEDDICDLVCNRFDQLGCNEALPTTEGHTCLEVCINLLDSPIPGIEENYKCVIKSKSCTQARECE